MGHMGVGRRLVVVGLSLMTAVIAGIGPEAAGQGDEPVMFVYSGRGKDLVAPVFRKFREKTGIRVLVRYGGTAELAAALLEEGDRTIADVFLAQDAGALGAVSKAGLMEPLPEEILEKVSARYRAEDGSWVGITGRARTIVFNTSALGAEDVPDSVMALTDPRWKGRVGWAPTNGSFQAFVTAMRRELGEQDTEQWLRGMIANGAKEYPKNSAIVRAAGAGEIDLGLVNHYYLYRFKAEDPDFPAANSFTRSGDPGSLVNVAGCGIIRSGLGDERRSELARELISYLLSEEAQSHFAKETNEYPLVEGVDANPDLPSLDSLNPPSLDLGDLDDLEGTLELLRKVGALP